MRTTIASLATVAVGLLASTASAKGQVAIYWGQGAYQKELSVVCNDPSVDIVNIAFVNGFPKDNNTYPDTNFGNACGGDYYKNPDGTTSKLLANCPSISNGIPECHKNGKKVFLSLGGGYPTNYYIASKEAAKWLAQVLVGSFGPQKTGENWPRPFGASAVDGFDLDIESSSAVGAQKYQFYAELVNYIKEFSPRMLISSAPQCVVPDAHLDDAIARAPFDYIFTQFYNTDDCSAKRGFREIGSKTTGFTFDKWTERLQNISYNKDVKLFMGLTAGTNGGNPAHYLLPEEANALVEKYQKTALWGGIMLWEATVSQNNTVYGQGYSSWMRYSLDGTFKAKYKPVVSSTIRSSSTLVSSTRTSTPISTKTSTPVSSKTSTPVPSKSSTPVASSSSSLPHSSKSSSAVLSSTVKSSSTPVPSSQYSTSTVVSSSSAHVTSSSLSSVEYSDYFSTAIPTHYSASSSSVEPSSVYPDDVSSTVVPSSSSVDATSSASSSSGDVTSSASSSPEASSTPVYSATISATESGSEYSSSTPLYTATISASDSGEYYPSSTPLNSVTVSASDVGGDYSATSPAGASSTPCTTSSELYPESSKTPDVSSSASEYLSYSESSKIPEASSSVDSSSVVYPTESTKTPEVSTGYSASSSTPIDASSTPCSSTELYPTSTPEASSATDYSYYTESSKVPEVSSKITEYPVVSTKTPEASSSEYSFYSESSPVPAVSSKTFEYPVESSTAYPVVSTKTPEASEYEILSTATPTVTKPAESTTTVVTTTYVDTCSTGLTTKTTVITKTVCNACTKPSDKPEADYPEDWTTSVYVSKTLTVTITKPIQPATDVPAYPTETPVAPKPSAPVAEYPVGKEEVPSYEAPAKSTPVSYEVTKPSPKPEVPSYPEVPSVEKPSEPEEHVTLTKVATPVAYTPVAYATPVAHHGYPVGNATVPSGTGAVKPSATGTGKPIKPSGYAPPEFEGAASKLGMGMTGAVAVVAYLVL